MVAHMIPQLHNQESPNGKGKGTNKGNVAQAHWECVVSGVQVFPELILRFLYFANEEPVHTYFGIVLLPTRSCFNIRTYFATLLCRIAYQRLHVRAE